MNRAHKRNLITFVSLTIITSVTIVIGIFIRGYRPDFSNKKLRATGLLSATSIPKGAQVWIDDKLETATNQSLTLSPGQYQIKIKKPGFFVWQKEITIEKEVVADADAYLFLVAPDLKALTFTGLVTPYLSPDGTKLVYFLPYKPTSLSPSPAPQSTPFPTPKQREKIGFWLIDLSEKQLGRSFQPQILIETKKDFDFQKTVLQWSPDSKEILLTMPQNIQTDSKKYFLIDINQSYDFTTPPFLGKSSLEVEKILNEWQQEKKIAKSQSMNQLATPLKEILLNQCQNITFSPDEKKVLYQAQKTISIPEKFLDEKVIGASTQKESRSLKANHWYVYDRKEDKNFLVLSPEEDNQISWFPTSRHLLLVGQKKIDIVEYDGHNRTTLYSGPFEKEFVFPFPSGKQLLILTSLNNSQEQLPNLYSISLQ